MISIVVLNFHNPALLRLSLKSIVRSIAPGIDYELIVVDSESNLETQMVAREEFPQVLFLPHQKNLGYTRGINLGMEKARGDFILILNPDVVPLEGSIEKLMAYLEKNHNVGLVGPRLLNFDGTPQNSCFRFYTPLTIIYRRLPFAKLPFIQNIISRFLIEDKNKSQPICPDWLMGSAVMIRKSALEKVGLMDERFFHYMSDVDWARRFWNNGYKIIYYPLVKMYHYHQRSSRGKLGIFDAIFNKQTRWHIIDAIKYFRKYGFKNPDYVL